MPSFPLKHHRAVVKKEEAKAPKVAEPKKVEEVVQPLNTSAEAETPTTESEEG